MNEPRVKGMAVINARDWLDARLGQGWFTKTCQAHDPSWPERILPGDWYSVRTEQRAFEAALAQLDDFDELEQLMSTIAAEVALNDLNGILRAFLWVASPKMFLRTSPRIWSTYADFTSLEPQSNESGCFVIAVRDIPADITGWVVSAWRGFLPPALELAGGKDPVVEISERRQTPGAETWEFVYTMRYSE